MSNIIIRNQSAHYHHSHRRRHHYHHTKNENSLNNLHEVTNEATAETHNNNNNGRIENTRRMERSPETVELLNLLQTYFLYILILLFKGAYDQRLEIINTAILLITFLYVNNDLKIEIAKQQNRSCFFLLSIMCFIAGSFFVLNILFDRNVSTTQPLSFLELVWLGSNPSAEQLINSCGPCATYCEEYRVPIKLKCQHIFCEVCLSTGRLCPMCRAPITDDAIYHNGHTTLFNCIE